MSRLSLFIAGGLAASFVLTAHAARADSQEAADSVMKDVDKVVGTSGPILGSVIDTSDLTSGSTEVGLPYGEGFSAEEWELDESLGKPIFSLANKALAEKGEASLEARGIDTGAINQGLSLQGGEAGVGMLNASPEAAAVMSSVTPLMSPSSYIP